MAIFLFIEIFLFKTILRPDSTFTKVKVIISEKFKETREKPIQYVYMYVYLVCEHFNGKKMSGFQYEKHIFATFVYY